MPDSILGPAACGEARLLRVMRTRWFFWSAAVAGMGLAVWCRLPGFDAVFWRDEIKTRWVCSHGLTEIPTLLARDDVHPPFHYLLLNVWMSLFGNSDAALRASSLVTGLAVVALGCFIALRWWGKSACLVMLALSATAPGMAYLSLEVRNQVIVSLLLLLAVWGLWAWWHTGRARWLACYALASAAALYSHYLAWPALLMLVLGFVAFVGKRRALRSRAWWAANAAIILLLLPWVGALARQLEGAAESLLPEADGSVAQAARSTTAFLAGVDPLRAARVALRTRLSSLGADAATLGLLGAIVLALAHARRAPLAAWGWVALCGALGVAVIMGALHGLHGVLSHSRYFPMFSPLLLLPVALGIARAPRVWALGALVCLLALQVVAGKHTVRRAPVPWPGLAALLEEQTRQQPTLVLSSFWLGAKALRQYGYRGPALDLPFDLPGVEAQRGRRVTSFPLTAADWPRMDAVLAGQDRFCLITSTVHYDIPFEDELALRDYLRTRNWQQRTLRAFGAAELRLFVRGGETAQARRSALHQGLPRL